jgi:hypothetical protein
MVHDADAFLLLVAVLLRVRLRCFPRVMQRMLMTPVRRMRVVGRFLMIAAVVKCRGLLVVTTRVVVMLCRFAMMYRSFFRHPLAPNDQTCNLYALNTTLSSDRSQLAPPNVGAVPSAIAWRMKRPRDRCPVQHPRTPISLNHGKDQFFL